MPFMNNLWNGAKHLSSEVLLLSTLTYELAHEMGSRVLWVVMLTRLLAFVFLLLIPFNRTAFLWILDDLIEKGVRYGPNARNFLDIYHPKPSGVVTRKKKKLKSKDDGVDDRRESDSEKLLQKSATVKKGLHENSGDTNTNEAPLQPVIIFLTGGAWIIGWKNWGAFMGMLLAECGIVFVCLDYRNFPQGTVGDMKLDVDTAIQWVFDHCLEIGGDPKRIFLVGQSAGGHLANLVVLDRVQRVYFKNSDKSRSSNTALEAAGIGQAKDEGKDKEAEDCCGEWHPNKLAGFINIAGPCDMVVMRDHIHRRGLYSDVLSHIMGGDLRAHCPLRILEKQFVRALTDGAQLSRNNLRFADMSAHTLLGSSTDEEADASRYPATYNDDDDDVFGMDDDDSKQFEKMLRNFSHDSMDSSVQSERAKSCSLGAFSDDCSPRARNQASDSAEECECLKTGKTLPQLVDSTSSSVSPTLTPRKRRRKKVRKYYAKEKRLFCERAVDSAQRKAPIDLCPVYLFHGGADNSAPPACTVRFAKMLTRLNCETYLKIYDGKTHTGPIIEDPIQGSDPLICDLLRIVHGEDLGDDIEEMVHWIEEKMHGNIRIPDFVVALARIVVPF